jgi:Lrp/AsnC family transcriptional regulator, leucine-responsive regulatory protein
MNRLRSEGTPLDRVDIVILRALAANGRIALAELARMVDRSAPSVAERVRRLEEAGVIEGYQANVNPAALGLAIAAWIRIRPLPGELGKVAGLIRSLPQIVECDRITGEDCFLARAHVASVGELETLIDRIIPFAMTNSAIIQSSPVRRRLPSVLTQPGN